MTDDFDTPRTLIWRMSTASGLPEECVEVASHGTVVYMRDSKNRSGPVLTFTRQDWRTFLNTMRNGEIISLSPQGSGLSEK